MRTNPSKALSIQNSTVRHGTVDVSVRDYIPTTNLGLAPILWVHGGAFAAGTLDMGESKRVAQELATRSNRRVRAATYRKVAVAPVFGFGRPKPSANQFPAAVDDIAAVVDDLMNSDPSLIVGGASAGACILASVLLQRRNRGQTMPAAAILAYGTFHAQLPTPTPELLHRTQGTRFQFDAKRTRLMNLNYAGTELALAAPTTFPGGQDLHGLPATLALHADRDLLRSSGEAFTAELRASGVEVEEHILPDSAHGFLSGPRLTGFNNALDHLLTWL